MSYSSGFSSSLQTSQTSNDDSSSSTNAISTTLDVSSPDDSDGMDATVGGEAIALGEDTLAVGDVSGAVIDQGTVTTADLSATMIAASETEGDDAAFASADTFATVSDGADIVFTYNQESDSTAQDETGSVASATSQTELTAFDFSLPDFGGSVPAPDEGIETVESEPEPTVSSFGGVGGGDLDGNIAVLQVGGVAVGEDSFAGADAFVLAVEDQLSISSAFVELAVE